MARTYYSLVDADGYIELSQYTTDPNDPKGGTIGKRLLLDVMPAYDLLTQTVNRVEPIPAAATAVPYEVVANPNVAQVSGTKITKRAFRDRFTMPEKIDIEMASLDDPAAVAATRQMQASLRVYLKDIDSASFIDLGNASVIGGVQMLATAGLITSVRATEILTTPVNAGEV